VTPNQGIAETHPEELLVTVGLSIESPDLVIGDPVLQLAHSDIRLVEKIKSEIDEEDEAA
jgi:hypothetical protein